MNWTQAVKQMSEALKLVPWSAYDRAVKEWGEENREMKELSKRYPLGAFLALMVVAGLNDYQLKGKAEIGYWPPLWGHLERSPVPDSLDELGLILEPFYRKERLGNAKVNRLWRFFRSRLAKRLWNMSPKEVAVQLQRLWQEIAEAMGQRPRDKTIAFSTKTLALGLLALGEKRFDFSGIPVPVDTRVRSLTPSLMRDGEIRQFWDEVLERLRSTEPRLTHLYLDSFLWGYAGASEDKRVYLTDYLGIDATITERIIQVFEDLKRNC